MNFKKKNSISYLPFHSWSNIDVFKAPFSVVSHFFLKWNWSGYVNAKLLPCLMNLKYYCLFFLNFFLNKRQQSSCEHRLNSLVLKETEMIVNPLTSKSDWHLISLYNITPESHIKVMRIREEITNWRSSWLFKIFSLSAPEEMYRERYGEYA